MTDTTANADMRAAWDGEEGERWAAWAPRYEESNASYRPRLLDAAAFAAADSVLDIGCGTGVSTRQAATRARDGAALGVDLSSQMLQRARDRARDEGVDNVTFEQGDAQVHPFAPGAFDVAISSFGAMFFDDPVAAFANIGAALAPGGRVVMLAWREMGRNPWMLSLFEALRAGRDLPNPPVGVPGPFGLADADFARRVLTDAGFSDIGLDELNEPVHLGADIDAAYDFAANGVGITKGMLHGLDEGTRAAALDRVRAAIEAAAGSDGVSMESAAWLITARR